MRNGEGSKRAHRQWHGEDKLKETEEDADQDGVRQ